LRRHEAYSENKGGWLRGRGSGRWSRSKTRTKRKRAAARVILRRRRMRMRMAITARTMELAMYLNQLRMAMWELH